MKRITQNQSRRSRNNCSALLRVRKLSYATFLSFVLSGTAQVGHGKEISPADDYCREINDPSSGMEIVLKPGDYKKSCKIRRSGRSGLPLIVRALDLTDRPRIEYKGTDGNVLEIYANNVVIHGLKFGPTNTDVDGIRIFSGDYVTVEDCSFDQMGGIAIVANHRSIKGLIARRNSINNSFSTGMYFGCHDGATCTDSDLLIEKNFIGHIAARESEIGYGIEVKLNSVATLRDNVIVDTKGPGIMVYGANDLSKISIVERNFVSGSRESSGVVVGGGPVVVINNVSVGNNEGGVALEDYGRRGLLRKVVVTYNTVYDNGRGGILISSGGSIDAEISHNAVAGREGTLLFPVEREGLRLLENQDCRNTSCFVDPVNKDFTPVKDSKLFRTEESTNKKLAPVLDYFGRTRGDVPVTGAIEPPGGLIIMGIKP